MDMFIEAVVLFNQTARQFPKEVKSRVVYTDLETAGTELNAVRDDASL